MPLLKHQPLHRQVVTLSCLLLLPLIVVIAWAANRTRLERMGEVRQEAVTVAVTAAAYLDEYLKGLDTLASALIQHPAVASFDREECDRLFARLLREQPLLTDVFLSTTDGVVRGSGLPGDGRIEAPWLKRAVREARPQVGEFGIGPLSGKPIVMMGYPVLDDDGGLRGVLGLTIDLTQLQAVFANIPLPSGSVVTVFDRNSRIMVRTHDSARFVGTMAGSIDWSDLPRTARRVDVDGVDRLNGDAQVKRAPWILTVGIPRTIVAARLLPLWLRNLTLTVTALAGSLLLSVWLAGKASGHVNELRAAVQRIANGDLSPPVMRPVPNQELADLQDAFVTMSKNLREAYAALDRRVEHERGMKETLQSLQRQVVRQERLAAVGLLSAGVAHELNNPLQAILGAAALLERQDHLSPEVIAEIDLVKAQGMRAREIIRNLSRFSSSDLGPPSRISLRDVVAEALSLRARDTDIDGVAIDVHTDSTRQVSANFTELEQVTLNFVRNAQQAVEARPAVGPPGRIQVRVLDVDRFVRLEVSDNGPGVPVEDEQKLFQPFFTTKQVGQGSGLGLSVSYGIVQSYGGTIGYLRNRWGGATFYFELPALESAVAPTFPSAELRRHETTGDRATVLRRPA